MTVDVPLSAFLILIFGFSFSSLMARRPVFSLCLCPDRIDQYNSKCKTNPSYLHEIFLFRLLEKCDENSRIFNGGEGWKPEVSFAVRK